MARDRNDKKREKKIKKNETLKNSHNKNAYSELDISIDLPPELDLNKLKPKNIENCNRYSLHTFALY